MSSPASAPAGSASSPASLSAASPTSSNNTISPVSTAPPPSPPPPVQNAAPAPAKAPPPPSSSSPPVQSPPSPAASSSSPPASTASPPAASTLSTPPPPPASSKTLSPPSGTTTASAPPPPPASTPPPSSSNNISTSTVAAIAIVAVFALSVLLVLGLCLCKKKKKKQGRYRYSGGLPAHYKDSYYDPNSSYASEAVNVMPNKPPPPPPPPLSVSNNHLSSSAGNSGASKGIGNSNLSLAYNDLAAATNGFLKANLLGEGGFGCVYKGVLANGQVVAVKQLKSGASQGEKEFQAEVETISRVHHRNLVSLVGYCIMDNQRLLVYDYVPNNTLEYHLHKKKEGPVLDWPTRLRIASGAARGLAYLHEDCHPRIIHRDIKSANILLDNDFEAQVSDFGLAKLTSDAYTHVTTRVMGTFGYLAPEYASSGKLTEKSDVFSFGVVLLELLTGRKPVDVSQPPGQESLVEWARPILAQIVSEEDLSMLADPSLNGVYDPKQMMQMIMAAAACVSHSATKRPRMGQVVRALEDETSLADLYKGLKPGHSSVYGSSFSSGEYEKGSYSADIRKFRMALNESTDGGMLTNPSSSSEYPTSREIDQDIRRPKNSMFSSSSES